MKFRVAEMNVFFLQSNQHILSAMSDPLKSPVDRLKISSGVKNSRGHIAMCHFHEDGGYILLSGQYAIIYFQIFFANLDTKRMCIQRDDPRSGKDCKLHDAQSNRTGSYYQYKFIFLYSRS